MKILQFVQKPQRRGTEVFAHQLSRELRHQGCAVCTVYLYPVTEHERLPLDAGDQVLSGTERTRLEGEIEPLNLQDCMQQFGQRNIQASIKEMENLYHDVVHETKIEQFVHP